MIRLRCDVYTTCEDCYASQMVASACLYLNSNKPMACFAVLTLRIVTSRCRYSKEARQARRSGSISYIDIWAKPMQAVSLAKAVFVAPSDSIL